MKYFTILTILFFSSPAFSVGAPDYMPNGPHPRIWLTESELSALAAMRDAENSKWTALESWCDSHINDAGYKIDPTNQANLDLTNWAGDNNYTMGYRMSGWAKHIYSYALAYQVLKQTGPAQNTTKASAYASRARTLMVDGIATALRSGEENNGLKALRVGALHDSTINADEGGALGIGVSGYKLGYSARFLTSVPVAYDWIYDTLSSSDKTLLTNMMLRWYDWTRGVRSTYNNGVLVKGIRYHEDTSGACSGNNNCTSATGISTQGYARNDIGNNFGGGHASLAALIGAATYGDYVDDDTYLVDIKSYLNTYVITPLESDTLHSGGDSPEGWNYGGGFTYTLSGLYGFYTATGDPTIPSMGWPKALVRASLHRISGDYLSVPIWGYWTGVPYKENRINHVNMFVGIEQKLRPDSKESKLGQYLLNNSPFTTTLEEWQNLFLNSRSVAADSPVNLDEPLSYLAKGNGLYASRSGWDKSNTILLVTARLEGKVTTSHEGTDEGHITLLRGPDVLLGHQNTVGDAPPSASFNTIVFNNASHHSSNPEPIKPSVDRYTDTKKYSYVSGDITNAWKRPYKTDGCLLFRRSLLHIRPGIILIYDVTRSNSAVGYLKDWYTQFEAHPTQEGNTITVTKGNSRAFISSLYPKGAFTETNPATGFYRVKFTPSTPKEYEQFLHVIEATGSTGNKSETTLITGLGGRGARIGNTVALFTDSETGENISSLSYTTGGTTHYICDLQPLTNYKLKASGSNTAESSLMANEAGIITFDLPNDGTTNIALFKSNITANAAQPPTIFNIK